MKKITTPKTQEELNLELIHEALKKVDYKFEMYYPSSNGVIVTNLTRYNEKLGYRTIPLINYFDNFLEQHPTLLDILRNNFFVCEVSYDKGKRLFKAAILELIQDGYNLNEEEHFLEIYSIYEDTPTLAFAVLEKNFLDAKFNNTKKINIRKKQKNR